MIEKRGQVTIFIIIAVLIVGAVLIFLYIKDKNSLNQNIPKEVQPVYELINDCLEKTGEDALKNIGERGGYYIISEDIPTLSGKIPYYYYGGKSYLISKENIEQSISDNTANDIKFCLDDIPEVRNKKISLNFKNLIIDSKIYHDGIYLKINSPISISNGESTSVIESFETKKINNRLFDIYNVAKEISLESQKNKEEVCLDCMFNLALMNNLTIFIDQLESDVLLFIIEDFNESKNSSYIFQFANKYSLSTIQDTETKKMIVLNISDKKAYVGEEFNMRIIVSEYNISYNDHTPLFNIDSKGFIKFTPESEDIGNHSVWITISDGYGNTINKIFNLEIK